MTNPNRRRLGVPGFVYLVSALIFVAAFVSIIFFVNNLTRPIDRAATGLQDFEVNKGESVTAIGDRLTTDGLVRSSFSFKLAVKKEGLSGKIQAGQYRLSPSMSGEEIAKALTKGMKDVRITIPEGFRLEQIASTVTSALGIAEADFLAAAKGEEGYLFPDTYFIANGTGAERVVSTLRSTFDKKTEDLVPTKDDIILASLVERETKADAEKPVVAGILKKRLTAGWPLQLDATIQYIAGDSQEWWPNTTLLDRQRPSLYNTYLNRELPPGPICSPGLASIKAVLSPEESPYWYYLHGQDGTIRYAETSEEHEANIEKFLR